MPKARDGHGRRSETRKSQRQAYHLTCSNCRTRKVKCDSGQPQCGICIAYGESCQYDKVPPMSQIQAMADRIAELEHALDKASSSPHAQATSDINSQPNQTFSTSRASFVDTSSIVDLADSPWYASTSAVDEPTTTALTLQSGKPNQRQHNGSKHLMETHQFAFWEDAAMPTCATLLQLSMVKVKHLLKTHSYWVHPSFMFVDLALFFRDAASGGTNFSQLLLTVLCLHSTRFTDHHLKDDLLARSRLLLGQSLHDSQSLTMVQSLLQLSAHEIGRGSIPQAWLYSGMAFRIAIDLGIFSEQHKSSIESENCSISRRLAWSCYLWDKAMSLYLGRIPTLQDPPDFDPPSTNDIIDHTEWVPYDCKIEETSLLPPIMSHTTSCFHNFCHIALILNDILVTVYGKGRIQNASISFIQEARNRLEAWRANSPEYLKIQLNDQRCSPPHIITQNLLYHTTLILLHRPFYLNSACRAICQTASAEVEGLLLSLERSFGFAHVTYLMAYCAYTAATVALQDLRDGINGSHTRVNTYLRALHDVSSSCPGIQRSINIIVKNLDAASLSMSKSADTAPHQAQQLDFELLPAFPFTSMNVPSNDFEGQTNDQPFGSLDFFAHEWSTIPDDQLNGFLL